MLCYEMEIMKKDKSFHRGKSSKNKFVYLNMYHKAISPELCPFQAEKNIHNAGGTSR